MKDKSKTKDKPQKAEQRDVSIAQAAVACAQAATDADEREEDKLDWDEVAELPGLLMTEETFSSRIGQRFEIDLGQRDVHLELTEIEIHTEPDDLGDGAPDSRKGFSLVFAGHSTRALLPEGIYRLKNSELGEFEVYLRPIQRDNVAEAQHPMTPHLEAIFN